MNPIEQGETQPLNYETNIQEMFRPYTVQTVELSQHHPLTIITGQWGIGKTSFLIPDVIHNLQSRGYISENRWWSDNPNYFIRKLPLVERGVLLLDEALYICERNGDLSPAYKGYKLKKFISGIHGKGWNLVIVIAHHEDSFFAVNEFPQYWSNAEKRLSGLETPIIRIPRLRLDRTTAEAVLLHGHQSSKDPKKATTSEVIHYVLNTIPYHLGLLNRVGDHLKPSVHEMRKEIERDIDWYGHGHLTETEMRSTLEKCKQDPERF